MESLEGIAIIGMAGRFPGANNIDEFWQNLLDGKDTISRFTDEELEKHMDNFSHVKDNPDFVPAKGILKDVEKFDAAFFGISPNEAKTTDPQHRIWLETVWQAFENAACNPYSCKGAIGVFAGSLPNSYLRKYVMQDEGIQDKYNSTWSMDSFQIMINNDPGFLATKTAYRFNLRGPAISVQSACSTSLVAVSQACQSLVNYESDVCVAGGVAIDLPQVSGYVYQKGAITSPNGQCRPFDKQSSGTVASNGVGAVILKRLEDAVKDKDHIYAVIKGWATNNDGNNKVSYLAPSVEGQAEAIQMAQAFAEIDPADIAYIETHGTATPLGDPIEIAALTKAFRNKTDKKQYCAIGSVKSNIGHVDVAAGIAGLIKSALAAYHKVIPASIHFNTPNPKIDFKNSPFYVQKEKTEWKEDKPLNIGISSFGIGGTNAHVVLQEPPATKHSEQSAQRPYLIPVSARSEFSLEQRKKELIKHFRDNQESGFSQIIYTLQEGREHMAKRSFIVAGNRDKFLSDTVQNDFIDIDSKEGSLQTIFLFPGQGAQYIGMGKGLYEKEPVCKEIYDRCFGVYEKETGIKLQDIMFAESTPENEQILARTEYTQPALFITEYATARFLQHFGVSPESMIGHSIGEYTAACLAGVFSMEDALKVVIKRGQLMQAMPEGNMLAVKTDPENLKPLQESGFEIAAVNAPGMSVISLTNEKTEPVKELLKEQGLEYIPLNTSHAFHSAAFDPILEEFTAYVSQFQLNKPGIPFISCFTGDFIGNEMATDPGYWAKQLRNSVQFSKGVSTLSRAGKSIFVEAGPNTHLTSLTRRNNETTRKSAVFPTLGKPSQIDGQEKMIGVLGRLWGTGLNIEFEKFYSETPGKIALPVYPFNRKKFWIEREAQTSAAQKLGHIKTKETTNKGYSSQEAIQNKSIPEILKDILIDLTGFEPDSIGSKDLFSELGIESLYLTQYAQAIEHKFHIKIEFRQIIHDFPTLDHLSEYVTEATTKKDKTANETQESNARHENFIPFKPTGSKTPLVFVHGDNCDNFMPAMLDKEQPYLGYLHLGSDGEKYRFSDVRKLAKYYIDQLIAHKPHGPYILGGHSFGGIIAYEMAVQLTQAGHNIPLLIISDSMLLKRVPMLALKRGIKARCRENLTWYYCKSILAVRNKLPARLRKFYILNNYDRIANRYTPPKYDGKTLLIKASRTELGNEFLNWDKTASNIKAIELTGGHNEIINNKKAIAEFTQIVTREINAISNKSENV